MPNERVSQSAVQALVIDTPKIRVSQSVIQLLTIPGPMAAFCNNPPNGLVGQAYSTTFTQAGGVLPVTWSLVSGSFPTGLNLNASTGVLSGTPTVAGTYSFTVQATDSTGTTAQVSCQIVIGTVPVLTCNSPPTGTVGVFYSQQFGLSGGTPPYTLSLLSGSFPPGLSIAATSGFAEGAPYILMSPFLGVTYAGRISYPYGSLLFTAAGEGVVNGTPTAPGTYTFTLLLTDSLGNTAQTTCSITIQGSGGSPCMSGGSG